MSQVPEKYKAHFNETRWEYLCNLVAEKQMKITFTDFTISELKVIINEANLSETEKIHATEMYINKVKQSTIALKLGYTEGNLHYHKHRIMKILKETCLKIFK